MTAGRIRFRYGAAERAAAVVWLLASTALAGARLWLLPILALPLVAILATFRRGTDLDSDGVTVRAVLTKRRVPWSDVAELRPDGARRVLLVRTDGRAVAMPAVRPADLPPLVQ